VHTGSVGLGGSSPLSSTYSMSRVIGYRLPWPSAGAILFVAPVVAVWVDGMAAEDLRAGFADDGDGVVGQED
jgi:hypothetical protein